MKRLLVFTAWYPVPENPQQCPFVSQQVKMMRDALPRLSNEKWEIIVWHEVLPVDIPNRILRNIKPKNYDWVDDGILVKYRQSTILSHRLPINQGFLYKRRMKETYREIKAVLGGIPDCVWTVTLSAAILWDYFRKNNQIITPFFLQEHSNPLSMHLDKPYKVKTAMTIHSRIKKVCVVAERQIKEFERLSEKYDCKVIWNAVDPIFLRKSLTIPKRNTLLFVGRLSEEKGILRLIKAISIVSKERDVNLRIVGFGPLEEKAKELVKSYQIDSFIYFNGAASSNEIARILGETVLFVLPSYYENCPVSLLEAQVKGVPCLVTNNGASEKVLLSGNGISVDDDGTGGQLAEGIIRLLENTEDYDREKIRERSLEAFAPQVFTKKMYQVIKEAMD